MAEDEMSESDTVSIVLRAGGNLVRSKPLFSFDTKYLLCPSGKAVKVLSVASGECLHELRHHTDDVTSIQFNPSNQYQLFSCSLDKTLIKWDYSDGVVLKVYDLYRPLLAIYITPTSDTTLLVKRKSGTNSCELVTYDLSRPYDPDVPPPTVLRQCGRHENEVSIGCQGIYVAAVGKKGLTVHSLQQQVTTTHLMELDKYALQCVACHPVEYCVATGCKTGEIILWWNILQGKSAVRKSIKHWHALSVLDLTFSPGGSFMLSGGHECVLVKWQHDSHTFDTLPRLGAPIIAVTCSPDGTAYATSHTDNSIRVISNNFTVRQIFQGLVRAFSAKKHAPYSLAPFVFDPRTRSLVCNGLPGHIQFYSVDTDKQLFSLDIVQQNYVSSATHKRPLVFTEIEQVAFSGDSDWMATVERRDDRITAVEMRLKFWKFNQKTQGYEMNTCVDLPHTKCIHTLCFRPRGATDSPPMAVTTSHDGKFKLWLIADDTNIYRENMCWHCESVGYYRSLEAGSADFSRDGSLLAVAFRRSVTLWDPDTNQLRTVLPGINRGNDIKQTSSQASVQVLFGMNNCCHLLAVNTGFRLSVWNLLTCTVQWSLMMNIQQIARNPLTDDIAVFTTEKGLKVFNLGCERPIYERDHLSDTPIVSVIFIPRSDEGPDSGGLGESSWQQKSQLYFINKKQELLTLEMEDEVKTDGSTATVTMATSLPPTPFSILLAQKRERESSRGTAPKTHNQFASQFLKQMLDTPAHVLPPVSSLCNSFLETLLIRKGDGVKKNDDGDDSDDDDQPMDVSQSSSESEEDVQVREKSSDPTGDDAKTKPSHLESKLREFAEISKNENMFGWMEAS